jgi:hypothetical protein
MNNPPSWDEVQELANTLIFIPFILHNNGHRTTRGGLRYIRSKNKLLQSYINFFENQNDATWNDIISAWGGQEFFDEMAKSVLHQAVDKIIAVANQLEKP